MRTSCTIDSTGGHQNFVTVTKSTNNFFVVVGKIKSHGISLYNVGSSCAADPGGNCSKELKTQVLLLVVTTRIRYGAHCYY